MNGARELRRSLLEVLEGARLSDYSLIGEVDGVMVTAVTSDSTAVVPGALFCCLIGTARDGHDFADSAVRSGAIALMTTRKLDTSVPQVVVREEAARTSVANLAASFWGHPADDLTTVGVTGTNGKTTVTHMLARIFESHGWPTLSIGTLSGGLTTPDASSLQASMAAGLQAGKRAAVMEVSSHGLAGRRVDGFIFDVAVFTNLGHDHLDFHGSIEEYFKTKSELFTSEHARRCAVNSGDSWGAKLLRRVRIPAVGFSMADASDLHVTMDGSSFVWRGQQMRVRLPGRINAINALAAATTAEILGVDPREAAEALASLESVPGRLERTVNRDSLSIFVDFAHTPEALAGAIAALRESGLGRRLVVVFGCGGDRDATKRPEMGTVAVTLADLVVVTSDNPRSEDPRRIIEDIEAGVPPQLRERLVIEPDREAAIALGIEIATAGGPGTLLVAGKGHEVGQIIGADTVPFDDREVTRRLADSEPSSEGFVP